MNKYWNLLIIAGILVGIATACQDNPYKQGEILYNGFCANCHMEDGIGLVGNIPPLVDSDFLVKHKGQVACVIRYGLSDTIEVNGIKYWQPMAGIPQLSEIEITNIINYINSSWGNANGFYPLDSVMNDLKSCPEVKK